MANPTPPDLGLVQALMAGSGCSRERAVILLQENDNDLERAQAQYTILERYFGNSEPARSRSRTPDTSPPHHLYSNSDESSEEDTASEPDLPELVVPGTDRWHSSDKVVVQVAERSVSWAASSELGGKSTAGSEAELAEAPAATTVDQEGAVESSDLEAVGADHSETIELQEWDFRLPTLGITDGSDYGQSLQDENVSSFDSLVFARAIKSGVSMQTLQSYLEQFSERAIGGRINEEVEGFPLIFYVVQSNNEHLLRYIVAKGGNPEAIHVPSQIPLLAFAIVNSQTVSGDKTLLVATLLSLGVPASVIPSAFYTPYLRDLPEDGPGNFSDDEKEDGNLDAAWCTENVRRKLASTMTLSQRYYLEKAATLRKPTPREVELAERRNAEGLLGIPYFLIGQSLASHLLLRKLLSHILSPSKRPLVMVFAGPSGHGKTELARRLGHLLSLELEVVDCTVVSREIELFGPRAPYEGSERGSPLNNFLTKHDGQRCIVFLDEFEKTSPDIHKTLLLPFDNGEYEDRRSRTIVNCSNTIWILATNAHDEIIQDFYESHEEGLVRSRDKEEGVRLIKTLSSEIKNDFLSKFKPPLAGRISAFVPFLPFSTGEQAVIIHKYLLELGESIEGPVNLSRGAKEKLLGNVKLRIRRDASVCQLLAQSGYNARLGARSLITAVDTVKSRVVDEYLEINEGFSEDPQKTDCLVDVRSGEIVVKMTAPK